MNLRPYQLAALETSKAKWAQGITRQLIALPTGTGKTPLFSCVRDKFQFSKQVMVLIHREELAAQAADKLRQWNPSLSVGVEMGDQHASPMDDFVVASVATIGRANSERIKKFKPRNFSAIIVDEAHHSIAESYINVFNYFGALDPGSDMLLLGVTATPNRGDGSPLGQVYNEIVYQMSMLDAIKQGWLVDMRGVRILTKTSLDDVHIQAGDFKQGELSDQVNTPERNDLIVRNWLEKAKDRQTVAFTVDIKHAQDLAEAFGRYGVGAQAVWGDDPDRQVKLAAHKKGQLQVLCNCGVLTEGYDDPSIRCIVMARPTKSNLLFVQMAGRGTRLQPDIQNLHEARAAGVTITKEDCLLMDVVDNTSKHSLVNLCTIFGLGGKLDLKGQKVSYAVEKVEAAAKKNPTLDLSNITDLNNIAKLESESHEVNLFEVKYPETVLTNSKFQWHQNTAKDAYVLILPDDESVVIHQDLLGDHIVSGKVRGNSFRESVSSLPEAFRQADSFVSTFGGDLLNLVRREATWHADPATEKQLGLLRRMRIPVPANLSKGDAAKKITQHFATKGYYRKKAA